MGFRDYINFTDILGDKADVATSYHWELQIDSFPSAVYFPSDKVFKTRLLNCVPPADPSMSHPMEYVHGHLMVQSGDVDYSGTLQCQFQDFIDSSVYAMFASWRSLIMNPETRVSLNKADLLMDATLYQLDRGLNPVKQWKMEHGIITSFDGGEQFGGETQNLGKISAAITFEHVVISLLNT